MGFLPTKTHFFFLFYSSQSPTLIFITAAVVCCKSPLNGKLVANMDLRQEIRAEGLGECIWPQKWLAVLLPSSLAPGICRLPQSALAGPGEATGPEIRLLPPPNSVFLPCPHRGALYSPHSYTHTHCPNPRASDLERKMKEFHRPQPTLSDEDPRGKSG